MKRITRIVLATALVCATATTANARSTLIEFGKDLVESTRSSVAHPAPQGMQVETAFSPRGGGEQLVVKVIGSARSQLRLLAYGFTNPAVAQALVAAKRRGVDVRVAVDHKANISEDRSGKGRAALNILVNAGIPVRTVSVYPIMHDKVVLTESSIQTGSFNYTAAAEKSNSENVLVIWNHPQLVATYLQHWERNWAQGRDFVSSY